MRSRKLSCLHRGEREYNEVAVTCLSRRIPGLGMQCPDEGDLNDALGPDSLEGHVGSLPSGIQDILRVIFPVWLWRCAYRAPHEQVGR